MYRKNTKCRHTLLIGSANYERTDLAIN